MRLMRWTGWRGVAAAILVTVVVPSCATVPRYDRQLVQQACQVVVYNRTPLALEIRLRVRPLSTAPIGALNPGELLTHSVSCAEQRVWVAGIEIPWQVGAPPRFGALYGEADLVEGERTQIALHWP